MDIPNAAAERAANVHLGSVAECMAAAGLHVFPLLPGKNTPATQHGHNDATLDADLIRRWWDANPRLNVGVACQPSGLAVVDCDTGKPWDTDHWGTQPEGCTEGGDILINAAWEAGIDAATISADLFGDGSVTALTPSGGWHFYFQAPTDGDPIKSAAGFLPWCDTRGFGGYVCAPWSVRPDGRYRAVPGWQAEWDADGVRMVHLAVSPPPIPAWLLPMLPRRTPPQPLDEMAILRRKLDAPRLTSGNGYAATALEGEAEKVAAAPLGQGNATLNTAAYQLGQLVADGLLDEGTVTSHLLAAAVAAGQPEGSARRTIQSGLAAGMRNPRTINLTHRARTARSASYAQGVTP